MRYGRNWMSRRPQRPWVCSEGSGENALFPGRACIGHRAARKGITLNIVRRERPDHERNQIRQQDSLALNGVRACPGIASAYRRAPARRARARARAPQVAHDPRSPGARRGPHSSDGVIAAWRHGRLSLRLRSRRRARRRLFAIYSGSGPARRRRRGDDVLLLTDDLPIDAYLDRGFEAWLKKTSAK